MQTLLESLTTSIPLPSSAYIEGGSSDNLKQFNLIITQAGICQPDLIKYFELKNIPIIDLYPFIMSRLNIAFDELPNEYIDYDKLSSTVIEELFAAIESNIDKDTLFIIDLLDASVNIIEFLNYIKKHYNVAIFFINADIEAGIEYIISSPKKYGRFKLKRYLKHIQYYYSKAESNDHDTITLNYKSIKNELLKFKKVFDNEKDLDSSISEIFESFELKHTDTAQIVFLLDNTQAEYINISSKDLANILVKFDEINIG